jgi:transcriptional regulator with XRE-family HTH domain
MNYSYHPHVLAEKVRSYRQREGMTLRDLEEVTQLSRTTLSRIENADAKAAPDTQTLIMLLNACNILLEEIIQSDDEAGKAQLNDISTQLRASRQLSQTAMEALEAVIRAVRGQGEAAS